MQQETCRNQQYSITALTDSSGTIKERYAYSAYGTPTITDASGTVRTTTAEGNRYLFTGREYDDVADIYHYRARIYLSRLGRFGSRDPIGYVDGLSRYATYFFITDADPSGEQLTLIPEDTEGHPWHEENFPWRGRMGETRCEFNISCKCSTSTTVALEF